MLESYLLKRNSKFVLDSASSPDSDRSEGARPLSNQRFNHLLQEVANRNDLRDQRVLQSIAMAVLKPTSDSKRKR